MRLENDLMVKRWEVFESKTKPGTFPPVLSAYMPTKNDVPTIGWGHTKRVKMNQTITEAQAEAFFWEDVDWAEATVNKAVKVPVTQQQFDAMVSLAFNIGAKGFSTSSVVRRVNEGDIEGAARAFLLWNKQTNRRTGKKEVLPGLFRRRKHEADYFLSESVAPKKEEIGFFASFLKKLLVRIERKDNG